MRWVSNNVSFSLIGHRKFENSGFEQVDRLAKLTFIMANDSILKERLSYITTGKSKLSLIKEYDWLRECIEGTWFLNDLVGKAMFYVPTIIPESPKINVSEGFKTELEGLYVVGESAGVSGLLSAMVMGINFADFVGSLDK